MSLSEIFNRQIKVEVLARSLEKLEKSITNHEDPAKSVLIAYAAAKKVLSIDDDYLLEKSMDVLCAVSAINANVIGADVFVRVSDIRIKTQSENIKKLARVLLERSVSVFAECPAEQRGPAVKQGARSIL